MRLETANMLAHEFLTQLRPHCERAEIAGSIRRHKPQVKDIEIVCVASIEERTIPNLFGEIVGDETINWTLEKLPTILQETGWTIGAKNGDRYKQLIHLTRDIKLDLFIVPDLREWGAVYLIRTGPGEFNKALMTWLLKRGMHLSGNQLHHHPKDTHPDTGAALRCINRDCPAIIPTPTEAAFFEAVGLSWCDPRYRSPKWLLNASKTALGLSPPKEGNND